ncbi:MAG: response regulator [Gemmatimonadetes bacterium]|nr:response regulator [Gemmatimonadota bacterium]
MAPTTLIEPEATPVPLHLARRFHDETRSSTFGHIFVVVVLAVFLWDLTTNATLLIGVSLITIAAAAHFFLHRSARTLRDSTDPLLRRIRIAALLPAAAWGAVSLILAATLPDILWSRYLLVIAGIVAAATATHVADRPSYHLFSLLILGPAAFGTLLQEYGRNTLFDLLVILAFGAMMAWLHERAHQQLLGQLSTGSRLEAATLTSIREKEFLDGVLASVPDAMALVDPNDSIARMNDEFQGLVVPTTLHGSTPHLDDVSVSGLGAVLATTVRQARDGGIAERECRTSVEGETCWFIATAARASGQADGWIFLQLRDITGLRSAQEAQRKAEADLADMVEAAHDLIWRVDNRGRWTFLNAAAEEIYGEPRSKLLGTKLLDQSPAEQRAEDREALRQILEGGSLVNHLMVQLRADGERRWISLSGSPLRDDTDAVVGAHGIGHDVTAEVQARAALEELALRNSLVRSLVNASDDMIFYKDVDSVYRGSNDAFAEFLQLPDGRLDGLSDHDLFPAEVATANRARDREVIERREPIRYEANYDAESPERVWETVQTTYVSDTGEVLGILGISREMTAWKTAQERIQRMAEEAEHAAQMKSAFLANMSHEIRTPMNGVLGMSELLQDTPLEAEQRQYVDVIRSSAENLLHILNDILDFSKIEAGHLELDYTPFDLHQEIGDAVRVMSIQASRKGNELMVDIGSDVPRWTEGDPGRLRQIITNLVSNAVKFTEDGEVEVRVRRMGDGTENPAHIRVEVRDTGIGIAEDKQTLIFQEFSQADTSVSRRYGGTGLGLAISRRLVRLMGGEMELESADGEGSTFAFDVLLEPCTAPDDGWATTDVGPVDLAGSRILVVDDNATNRRILRSVLTEAGATVHQADSGAAALFRLDELDSAGELPDLVILDVQMPEMDGLEVIERLRTRPDYAAFQSVPLLVLTSVNRTDDARRIRGLGVEGYFLKPLPRPDLLRAVAAIRADISLPDPGARPRPSLSLGAHLRHHRILVVEDNPVNRLVATATLEKAGYRVEVATNGHEALAAVRDHDFQLVLMDIQMPGMDGIEASKRIRALEAENGNGVHLPVIALTAHALDEERERCLAAGMDDFLAKPFRAEDLLGILERWTRPRPSGNGAGPDGSPAAMASGDARVEPSPDEDPPLDLDAFRAVLEAAGIPEVYETTLSLFEEDLPRRRAEIEAARQAGDAVAVAEAAHAIRSAAGNVRADRLTALVSDLETAGRRSDRARIDELWPDVSGELERVGSFLRGR